MSNATAVTTADFEQTVLKSATPVMVDFWATWCGPCLKIAPDVDALAAEYQGKVNIVKVNVDDERDIAEKYDIRSIPTLMFFKDGKLVDQLQGAYPKNAIAAKLESLL